MALTVFFQAALADTPPHEITILVLGVIGVLFALLAQTGAMFFFGGQVKASLLSLKAGQEEIKDRVQSIERNGTPLSRAAAEVADKEYESLEALRLRLENHIAALGTTLVRVEGVERRIVNAEVRCDGLHPSSGFTQRVGP